PNTEPSVDDAVAPRKDRAREAAGGAEGFHGFDLPAHRAASSGIHPAPGAAQSVLDTCYLFAHHCHDMPGHVDNRAHVLSTGAANVHRDGHDLSDAVASFRDADGTAVVSARDPLDHRRTTGRDDRHQPVLGGPGRADAHESE